jgi:hypothetical protein
MSGSHRLASLENEVRSLEQEDASEVREISVVAVISRGAG